jgi:hypothetical protein
MNSKYPLVAFVLLIISCRDNKPASSSLQDQLEGSWQLIYAAHIKKDTVIRNDSAGTKMIKILNKTHFAFIQHTVDKADTTGIYSSGGGTYTLKDSTYTEHLEFCSARSYEGNDFEFTIRFSGDTLIQTGIEKLGDYGIGQENLELVEKYIRIRD